MSCRGTLRDMVLDMLTSPREQIPPRVTPMKEDRQNSPSALCPSHRNGHLPQAVPHAPVLHCSDDPGSSSATRSPKTSRTSLGDGADSSEQKLYSDRYGTERPQDREESRLRPMEDKPTRSCKRKLDLTSLSLGSNDAVKSQDSEKKGPESPPPAKRWVIGPLFQSFKSKMASFTEIVMSPVRLFKPNELPAGSDNGPPSVTTENKEDVGTDGKENASPKEERRKSPVVQRLNFDSDSITVSDSEQNKVTISQNGSERRRDSIPEHGGTFGLLNPTSTRSTNQPHPLSHTVTDPDRTSLREGSEKAKQESTVLCEPKSSRDSTKHEGQAEKGEVQDQNQPSPKKLRLQTLVGGKRKKGRRLERREREETVERVGEKGTVGTLDREEEESSVVTQTKTLGNETLVQTLNLRKPQVSVNRISISMCNSGDVQMSGLRPCNSSERERVGQKRASRSRSKRENGAKCTLVASDFTSDSTTGMSPDRLGTNGINSAPAGGPPLSGSTTCATGNRTTRRRKQTKPTEEIKPDITGSRCGDPTEPLRSSNGASASKPARRNNICRAKRKTETSATPTAKKTHVRKMRRVKRDVDAFEDQGMSMSLTLKVGSGLDGEKDANSVMTCGLTTKGRKTGEGAIHTDASCPTPEGCFCVTENRLTDGDVEKPEADRQTRWCVYSEQRETQEELENDDDPNAGPTSSGSNGLKRSLSCPDITSLQHGNVSRTAPVHDKTLYPSSPLKKGPHVNVDVPSPIKRTRRHTVCSLEMAREIAPLCLRKEVYPKWGSGSNHSYPNSPSKSLAFLVSCFLSSPLAFLSKKSSRGHDDDSGYGASGSDLTAASSSFPSPPSLSSPTTSRVTGGSAFFTDAPCARDQSSLSSHCSVFNAVSMETDEGAVQQEGNKQISAVSEEKALSDSEIKTDNKQVERRKVSSIRIRKTLPKPQYNLTPMGLPKAVRIKKKVFSVEEIYTNKNFSKPPEGRLETIFEVPLSRRDGSQSLIGPKRVKRFVEFPELGVARKPRRSLFGGAGGGGAQRKAAGNPGTGRTRRGREEVVVHLQDVDLLLCTKLNELDVWMAMEQMVY
ncbi:hypothetical protein Q7C36_017691 [Tachysurus vachellii]|uniref:Tantalus-like domain-containing protein n=1 Tax=Tachysurus vachellii TaxID=175792 RepID=A0AA88M3P0_TACVA|nr:hypothetical protein Q7C36_017691 [Tachysurus vachellii]